MTIYPLNDHILVKRLEAEDKSKGGIHLPDTAKERPRRGTVLAVGPGKKIDGAARSERSPIELKKGTVVIFTAYAGSEIKEEGEEYLLLKEDDILAIVG